MKKLIYLDNAATTKTAPEVVEAMLPYFTEHFGNPSSVYSFASGNKEVLTKQREIIADALGAKANEIYFTAGGSESDNWALKATAEAYASKGKHIITSTIEHHAILHTCQYLEKHGVEVTYLDVDSEGFVSPADLEAAIKDTTILVSIMMVNNEVGTIQPIKELAAIAKSHDVLFHTDTVQAIGNIPIDVKELGVDFISMSAHKIYGPKGIGALYKRAGINIPSFVHGGAQEKKKRAGTENTAGIVGFGKAAELAKRDLYEHAAHSDKLRRMLWEKIEAEIPNITLNGPKDFTKRHPGNLNISFDFVEGESILLLLDANGISVSTGSACSSESLDTSHVLNALNVPPEKANGAVRFTVGDFTTEEDIDYVVEKLKEIVAKLRELSPVNGMEGWK
jgi:cysteine desulfurase